MRAIAATPDEVGAGRMFADAHLEAWCKEREAEPWPHLMFEAATATDLYESYAATLEAEKQRPSNLSTFAKGLAELGYEVHKTSGANVYRDLTLTTRRERAEEAVWRTDPRPGQAWSRVVADEVARHMARVDHGETVEEVEEVEERNPNRYDEAHPWLVREVRTPLPCEHETPDDVYKAASAASEAVRNELRASGWLDREVERRFGYFLNGHPFPREARTADDACDRLDALVPELDRMWAERPTLARQVEEAHRAYRATFPLPPYLKGDPRHIESARLGQVWHTLQQELSQQDATYDRLYAETKVEQANLAKVLAVLDRIDPWTGKVLDAEPVTTSAGGW